MWAGVYGLIDEIKRCEAAGATTASLALAYICIDTMAFLSMPDGKNMQGRTEFIAWVDSYLKGDPSQPYQYRGLDVYGARCALLHAFGSETGYHQTYPEAKRFCYNDGGMHALDPIVDEHLVVIGTASFLSDVVTGVCLFAEDCRKDASLRLRVEAKLPKVVQSLQIHYE